jgi:nucleotide-binding universal stress UspA family protein
VQRFKNILFTALTEHGIEPALQRAHELATRNDATLTVFGTVPEPSRLTRVLQRTSGPTPELLADQLRQELANRVATVDAPFAAQVEVAVGVPFISIVERVLRDEHDLVIITDDGPDSPVASTTKHLLRKCPCPVWVMRPKDVAEHRVLAAIDPEPDDPAEMNRLILDLASSHAELTGAELHVAHAWSVYGETALRTSPFLRSPGGELDDLRRETRDGHLDRLEKSLTRHRVGGMDHEVHLVEGDAGDVIPFLAEKHDITLLVMGTVGRTGVPGLIMGSNAERILDQVRCSVIAVKPEGFVSPVAGGNRRRATGDR